MFVVYYTYKLDSVYVIGKAWNALIFLFKMMLNFDYLMFTEVGNLDIYPAVAVYFLSRDVQKVWKQKVHPDDQGTLG